MTNDELMRIDRHFGNVVREGPWVVPPRIEVSLAAANARLGRLTAGGDLVVKPPKRNFDQRTRSARAS